MDSKDRVRRIPYSGARQMTMLAACRFRDGAVMIADSRATWLGGSARLFQDTLQKLLHLDRRIAIGFTGDVQAAKIIVQQLRQRMHRQPRLRIPRKLAANIPRIAKHYYALYRSRGSKHEPLALVLAAVTASGSLEIWWFESPNFGGCRLVGGFVVLGSGAVVAPYIQKNLERFDRDLPDLKQRADALRAGLEEELHREGVETVGGLLQVILLDSEGIRPLGYGFISLDPKGPARAKSMEMKAGRWLQRDLATGSDVPLVEPARLLRSVPASLRVQDFHVPTGESTSPGWHLTYFLSCLAIVADVGKIEFRGVMSAIVSPRYPLTVNVLAALGLWGSAGDHEIEFSLVWNGTSRQIHRESIHIEYLSEVVELAREMTLHIPEPGPTILECRLGGQLLGRRALFFGLASGPPPSSEVQFLEFNTRQAEALNEGQRACLDPVLEASGDSTLVYLSLCANASDQGTTLRFEGEMTAVYWKSYPLNLRVFLATAFRMPKGTRHIRVDLVNAATREVSPFTTATVVSTSSSIVTPVYGELVAVVPAPGIYFANVYVDDKLTGTALLFAETDHARYSYTLTQADESRVAAGELLILPKRAQQKKDSS